MWDWLNNIFGNSSNATTAADAASTASTVGDTASTASTAGDAASAGLQQGYWDYFKDVYQRFNQGSKQDLSQAWDNKGFNAETAGYAYKYLEPYMRGRPAAGGQAPSINVNYQQPDNPYLRKRGY